MIFFWANRIEKNTKVTQVIVYFFVVVSFTMVFHVVFFQVEQLQPIYRVSACNLIWKGVFDEPMKRGELPIFTNQDFAVSPKVLNALSAASWGWVVNLSDSENYFENKIMTGSPLKLSKIKHMSYFHSIYITQFCVRLRIKIVFDFWMFTAKAFKTYPP